MKRPKISVIVPVYNQEKYLQRSISSLKSQTFEDFEVILVNDGSIDSSSDICHTVENEDTRFRVIDKPNGGVASARQCGLNNAEGEYIIHVDPDDWVEEEFLSELYQEALKSGADMVVCDIREHYPDRIAYKTHENAPRQVDDFNLLVIQGKIWGGVFNKLIRAAVFKEIIGFEKGINFQEDKLFISRVLILCNTISFCNKALYNYNRTNVNSLMANQSWETESQCWKVRLLLLTDATTKRLHEEIKKVIISDWTIIRLLKNQDICAREYRRILTPFRKCILKNLSISKKMRLLYWISSYIMTDRVKRIIDEKIKIK